ncbi:MAG: Lrp/AsnC ligand binding domain-containing protein [Candidatus Bathyarchaeota archaeon]|nr:Lrp/AsnC ligand binding domain-containing protein [Candidatus Bathyarchaeota archaeon]
MVAHEMKGTYRASIYLDVSPGKDQEIVEKILEYDEVLEAHLISGKYDVLAVLEFRVYGHAIFTSPQKIVMNFVEKIRSLKHVLDTETVLPLRSLTKRE